MAHLQASQWLGWVLGSSALLAGFSPAHAQNPAVQGFVPVTRYVVGGAVAEILAATPDGQLLVFTNAGDQQIGFVDLQDPANPQALGTVDVSSLGEPTSVAVTPDGRYAVAAVLALIDEETQTIADQQPGHLVFIDIASREVVGQLQLDGIGPDSLAITPDGTKAVVAIEDEEDTENLPGTRPGAINIVSINYDNPEQSQVKRLELDLSGVEGVNYAADPQPEYVSIRSDGTLAAVSLQENNAIALIDLNNDSLLRIFSAGISSHERADLVEDGEIDLSQPLTGRREPDTLAFTPAGDHLVLLNEGDTELESFGDNVWSGGRGWSILDLEGNVVDDSGSSAEELAVLRGHYPEGRSENRGIEMEGGTTARFGSQDLAFVASERGSFLLVYDITNIEDPQLLQFLPTGLAPEGVLALPERNLVLNSNEGDGTIDIFEAAATPGDPYSENEPLVQAQDLSVPFSAVSGMVADPEDAAVLYAVPDSAIAPSRIYTLQLQGNRATVTSALILTKDGEPVSYDLEGIALHREGGYWLVSEGDDREGQEKPNILIRVNASGEVQEEIFLPEDAAGQITRFGFEGVTTNAEGTKVYIAIQREFEGDPEHQVRIAEYDPATKSWAYFSYPLDTDNVDGWVGLSEIAREEDGSLVLLERDNQGGVNGAANARVKRIYRVSLDGVNSGDVLEKTLVVDLLKDHNWLEEKAEGLAVIEGGIWVSSDNDGGETYTRLLLIPR